MDETPRGWILTATDVLADWIKSDEDMEGKDAYKEAIRLSLDANGIIREISIHRDNIDEAQRLTEKGEIRLYEAEERITLSEIKIESLKEAIKNMMKGRA